VDGLEPKSSGAVCALAAAFPALATLRLLHGHKLSDGTLTALAALAPGLRELHLDDTLHFPPAALAALPRFRALTSLSLRYLVLPHGFSLQPCGALEALSLAGAVDMDDADAPLHLLPALPAGLRCLDVSLARVDPQEMAAWAAARPGRVLCAFAAVDGLAGGPFPVPGAAAVAGARIYGDDDIAAAVAVDAEDGAGAGDSDARWLHAVVAHAVWAFLSLRDALDDAAPPPPPPGPREPSLRTPSDALVAAGVRLAASAHADVRECAAGMLSSLANVQQHLPAMLQRGGWAALLRLAASPRSELLQELAAEGLRNLTYQASLHAEAEPPAPGRAVIHSRPLLDALMAAWRAGAPRVRQYAALALSDAGRMVIHLEPDGSLEQAAAVRALLGCGAIAAFVQLMHSLDVGDQYAGARPLAVMSFLGRAGQEVRRSRAQAARARAMHADWLRAAHRRLRRLGTIRWRCAPSATWWRLARCRRCCACWRMGTTRTSVRR
jgi:hypothetical protein